MLSYSICFMHREKIGIKIAFMHVFFGRIDSLDFLVSRTLSQLGPLWRTFRASKGEFSGQKFRENFSFEISCQLASDSYY